MTKLQRLFLHVGHDKTGSTVIQRTLHENQDVLKQWGFAYSAGTEHEHKDSPLNSLFNGSAPPNFSGNDYLERLVERSHSGHAPYMILSHEGLFHLPKANIERLKIFLEGLAEQVDVIIYARAPLGYALSAMSQRVKTGHAMYNGHGKLPLIFYKENVSNWVRVFGRACVSIRAYGRDHAKDFDSVDDFLTATVRLFVESASRSELRQPAFTGYPSFSDLGLRTGQRIIELMGDSCPRGNEFRDQFYEPLHKLKSGAPSVTTQQLRTLKEECRDHLVYLRSDFNLSFGEQPFAVEPADQLNEAEVDKEARRILAEVMPNFTIKPNSSRSVLGMRLVQSKLKKLANSEPSRWRQVR